MKFDECAKTFHARLPLFGFTPVFDAKGHRQLVVAFVEIGFFILALPQEFFEGRIILNRLIDFRRRAFANSAPCISRP